MQYELPRQAKTNAPPLASFFPDQAPFTEYYVTNDDYHKDDSYYEDIDFKPTIPKRAAVKTPARKTPGPKRATPKKAPVMPKKKVPVKANKKVPVISNKKTPARKQSQRVPSATVDKLAPASPSSTYKLQGRTWVQEKIVPEKEVPLVNRISALLDKLSDEERDSLLAKYAKQAT